MNYRHLLELIVVWRSRVRHFLGIPHAVFPVWGLVLTKTFSKNRKIGLHRTLPYLLDLMSAVIVLVGKPSHVSCVMCCARLYAQTVIRMLPLTTWKWVSGFIGNNNLFPSIKLGGLDTKDLLPWRASSRGQSYHHSLCVPQTELACFWPPFKFLLKKMRSWGWSAFILLWRVYFASVGL